MARSLYPLMLLAPVILLVAAAQSVAPSNSSFSNTTSFSSATITSSPSQITASLSINTSCSSCVIAADAQGLQQIFWFSQTWSVTLDTEHVTVTSFNGSNATAVTNTRTALGDVQALNTTGNSYVASLMSKLDNQVMYFNPAPTLVRGTDGKVGTTSFPYGQAFAMVTAINYRYMLPNIECPLNMGMVAGDPCQCVMNSWFPAHVPISSMNTSEYTLDKTYYQALPSSALNENNAGGADDIDSLSPWDGEKFKAWLAEDEGFKSAIPNWEDCAFWNTAAGPPAVKLPVAALTATVSTTVHAAALKASPTPQPASQPNSPVPKPTSHEVSIPASMPTVQPNDGNSGGGSAGGDSTGSTEGPAGHSGSHKTIESSKIQPSPALQSAHSNGEPYGPSGGTGSQGSGSGDINSEGHISQGSGGASGSSSDIGSQGSGSGDINSEGHISQGNGGASGSSSDIGSQGNGSGDTGNEGQSSQGSGESSGGDNGLGTQEGENPGNSGSGSDGTSPGSEMPTAAVAFPPAPIATVGSHTINASPGASEIYYAGTTLSKNGPHATIDGTDIHVGSSGLVIGGSSTIAIPAARSSESSSNGEAGAMTFTAVGHIFTSSPSGLAVAGTTIQSGGAAVISGTTVSYGSSGLAIGTSTIPIPTPPPSLENSASPTHVFTLGSQTFTANPTAVYIAGTTLTSGGVPVTISGTAISLGSSGIVISSSTYAIPAGALPSKTIVVGSETFTVRPTAIEVAGTTLSEGGSAIAIHGTPVSLGPSGLVVAGSTVPYRGGPLTAASQTSEGLGAIILAGFGPSSTTAASTKSATGTKSSTDTPGVVGFQGAAARLRSWESIVLLVTLLVGGWVVACIQVWF